MRLLLHRRDGEYIEHQLDSAFAQQSLSPADRRLCQEVVYGIVRWQATIDWIITRKTFGRVQKPVLQNLLRLGLYQIFWMDRIPPHAAVNETVTLARQLGFGPQSGFINAVLRGCLRELDSLRKDLESLKLTEPHLGYSQPEWLVKRWLGRWSREQVESLLKLNNTPPATFARVNLLKATTEKLLPQWRDEQVDYDFVRKDWFVENLVFELKSHPRLSELPSFQGGSFYVQDPSTLLAVNALAPEPGQRVLDLCAAPGGKTTYIAQLMANEGLIVAHDVASERLEQVRQNCKRLGVSCVQFALPENVSASDSFDKVLVDAPCSNTGVMRRRVELRWRIRPEELERLRATQLELLSAAARYVKPGGTLVYSTCSIEPEENQMVVKEFLANNVWFILERERELLPFHDSVDGAYVAKLTRRAVEP